MTTIHFLCGMGVGALLATVFFLLFLCLLMRAVTCNTKAKQAIADKQHADLVELHTERNKMTADILTAALTLVDRFQK